jgi:hypothetical protein
MFCVMSKNFSFSIIVKLFVIYGGLICDFAPGYPNQWDGPGVWFVNENQYAESLL